MLSAAQLVPDPSADRGAVKQRRISSIQALRGLAALLVVFGHSRSAASELHATFTPVKFATAWGVDLFFVISGFIIVYSSERLFGFPSGPPLFLWRRLSRIVPLYWIATTVWLGIAAVKGSHDDELNTSSIMLSYLFIPNMYGRSDYPVPVLSLGWTLNYEMFFYIVFAGFVMLRRQAASAIVVALLCLFVVVGQIGAFRSVPLTYWSQPIILEFVMGILVALALRRHVSLPALVRFALVIVAIGMLIVDPFGLSTKPHTPNDLSRVLTWGLPAAAIFAATVLGSDPIPRAFERLAGALGDASYVLYLFHPIVLGILKVVWQHLHLQHPWLFVSAAMIGSVMLAILLHRIIERPLVNLLQNANKGRRDASSARA